MRRKQTVLHTAAAGLLSVCMALSLVGCPEIPGGGYVPPDSPVNSGSSEDSGETSGGGGGSTTSGPVANDPATWEVEGNTLSVPSGANVTAEAIQELQNANEGSSITAITFEGSVTIGDSAFTNSGITSVTGWENVISIGDNAFKNTNISGELNLSSATTIGASAFEGCTGITGTLNLSSATRIREGAFQETGVKNVTFGTGVTIDGGRGSDGAFAFCTSLTTVTFKGATTVGASAFYNCKALNNVSGLDMVTSIGIGAFGDTGLTSVKLGAGLTTLEPNAFIGCDSLTSADLSACTNLTSNTSTGYTIGNYTFRVSEGKSTALALKLPDEASSWKVDEKPFLNRGTVTLYYKDGKEGYLNGSTGELKEFLNKGAKTIAVAPAADFPNGSSGGTPDGQSLLSSFSAFRDLLS